MSRETFQKILRLFTEFLGFTTILHYFGRSINLSIIFQGCSLVTGLLCQKEGQSTNQINEKNTP